MKLNDFDMIRKESTAAIINHWALAGSCILLTITGFGFLYQIEFIGTIFGGFTVMKHIHNWLGVVFAISLLLSIPMWFKECTTFDEDDKKWIRVAGGYLSHKVEIPPMHKLNTAEAGYLGVLGMAAASRSGFVIWLSRQQALC